MAGASGATGPVPPLLLVRSGDAGRESLADYRARGGYTALARALTSMSPAEVLAEVESSELRGRGGAGFPVGRKWTLAASQAETTRYVVANGGEHEPGSIKDAHLMAAYPHTLIEGITLAGYATGARVAYIYLIEDMHDATSAVEAAIAEARGAGLTGKGILGSGFDLELRLHHAPTTYVAGEESAALRAIEGAEAKPSKKPPYPGESGLHGKPTTVNNVESLCHVPGILAHGAAWFRNIGAPGSRGTMLFTLDSKVKRPGLYELPFGATFRELIEGCGGGLVGEDELLAILPALSSAFLPASAIDTPMDHESLKAVGSSLGCGGVHLVTTGDDVAGKLLEIAEFFMREQCGQCPPCRMETNTFVALLKKLQAGEPGAHTEQMQKVAAFTRGKGHCSLIEMAAAPLLSGVELFAARLGVSG